MVKLSRLIIQNYRAVRPGTELRFRNGINLIVGRNGSGKTSLLELVSAIVTMDFSPLKTEALDVKFEALFDGDEVNAHYVQGKSSEEGVGADGFLRTLDLKLKPKGEADPLKVHVRGQHMTIERLGAIAYDGTAAFDAGTRPGMATLLDLVRQLSARQPLSQTRTLLAASRLGRAIRHDEGLDFLGRLFLDQPEIYVMPSEGTGPVALSFLVPEWILDGVAANVASGAKPPFLIQAGEESSLPRILGPLGLQLASAAVEQVDQAESGARQFRLLGLGLVRPDNTMIDLRKLSYGQRRLLSVFAYLSANPHLAIMDELTNGLDAAWIWVCLDQIGRRQAFLSVPNPMLFEHMDFDSGEEVRRSVTLCHATDGQLVWSELDEKPANAFYRSWKAGPPEFGNMLKNKELW